MTKTVRSVLAVIAGFIAAAVVMMLFEFVNGHVLYPGLRKAAEDVTDREALRTLLAAAPAGAFLVVLLGWAAGGLVGGFVAGRIGWHAPVAHALILGALLTLSGIANNLMLPPPAWFWVVSMLILLPCAYAGGRGGTER